MIRHTGTDFGGGRSLIKLRMLRIEYVLMKKDVHQCFGPMYVGLILISPKATGN